MPFCTKVRNPPSAASNRYGPTTRFGRTKEPVSFDTVVRATPVSVCVAVTSTPGNTAPVWSLIVPLIWAVPCAQIEVELNVRIRHVSENHFMIGVIDSSNKSQFWLQGV